MGYEVKVGDLKIETLGTEHFCTVCSSFTMKCYRHHRSGNLFVIKVNVLGEDPVFLLLSRGEFKKVNSVKVEKVLGGLVKTKMSGTKVFKNGKITKSGWISFSSPVLTINREDIVTEHLRTELSKAEKDLLNKLLDEHKLRILTETLIALGNRRNIGYLEDLIENIDLGVWSHLRPLLRVFISDRAYTIGKALISFVPLSFKAEFLIWGIKFDITKAKPDVITRFNGITEIRLGKQRKIYFFEKNERASVFYELPHVVYVHEQFRNNIHPPARLSPAYFEEYKDLLLEDRLGNVLFIRISPDDVKDARESELPEWTGQLKILQGHVLTDGRNYYVKGGGVDIVAYHPECGLLDLFPGAYKLEPVQFLHPQD